MNIEVTIDELVLDGVPVPDAEQLRSVVSAELARLISDQGLPPTLSGESSIPMVNGGTITVTPGNAAGSLGSQIARAVIGGLGSE